MWTGPQPVRRRLLRVPVAGHRRDDDVERVLGIAAVGRRVGQRADDVEHLDDRARPAVRDDQRQRVRVRRPDMDEVDVEAVDLGQELRERVQPAPRPGRSRSRSPSTATSACIVASGTPCEGRRRSPSRASASPRAVGAGRRCPPGGTSTRNGPDRGIGRRSHVPQAS